MSAESLSGRIEAGEHVLPLRVYYEDTDAAGIVYHANYLKFAERGRTDFLRLLGVDQSEMARRERLAFAVRDCTVSFKAPARLDDLIEVRSRLLDLKGATLRAEQAIRRSGQELANLAVRVACVTLEGRPVRIPQSLQRALDPFLIPA